MDNVIALGTFDGVHRGHRRLIHMTCSIAREQGMQPLIYTFSNHPLEAFHKTPGLLMSHQARIAMLGGFCPVVTVPFSREYAAMEPADFVRMLLETYHMGAAVGGFNYTFGNHGAGNMTMLRQLGQQMGFGAYEIPPEVYGNAPISSTRIQGNAWSRARWRTRPPCWAGITGWRATYRTAMGERGCSTPLRPWSFPAPAPTRPGWHWIAAGPAPASWRSWT